MASPLLQFLRAGRLVQLRDVPATRTLLQVLREDLASHGTKEGCAQGDCGACTVVVAQATPQGLRYRAINSCIRLAHSVHGMALWTVEDLAPPDASLHPVQRALSEHHGAQCGFCTPGIVMGLYAQWCQPPCVGTALNREQAQAALSGNLCRCTGYRPILDAAQTLMPKSRDAQADAKLLSQLEQINQHPRGLGPNSSYMQPHTLAQLLRARARHPQAQLVAGGTDVGVWITRLQRDISQVLDVTRVTELRRIETYDQHLAIGASVPLVEAFDALVAERPAVQAFLQRFAGLPIRNSGTLGGNVANGSPIGDSLPLLIALRASVVLMRWDGRRPAYRELALEDLYTGYRQSTLGVDEVLAWIKVPRAHAGLERGARAWCRAYKVSKRQEDDISAVCLALDVHLKDGRVVAASLGVGGVAATAGRATAAERALLGRAWTPETLQAAQKALRAQFAPLSDLRASSAYRSAVLGNLLERFWLETQVGTPALLAELQPALANVPTQPA